MKKEIAGKVVLITGASSGLGEALSHVFYLAGCKVVLAARRKDELERVRCDLMALQAKTKYTPIVLPLDLTDTNSFTNEANQKIFATVDILINNGGESSVTS